MERYALLLLRNERQINRRAARICLYELGVIMIVLLLDACGVFTAYSFAREQVWKLALCAILCLPVAVVDWLRQEGRWVKYVIMLCSVLGSGLCYIIFNVQASLLLIFPTVLAALYYDRWLSITTFAMSIVVILCSHLVANYLILPKWFQNPYAFRYAFVDTAIPQALFYVCFALVVWLQNGKTLSLILDGYRTSRRNEVLALEKETAELRGRLDERDRISRDIHNSVGHTIAAALFALEAADIQRQSDPAAAEEKTDRAIERLRESMETLRNSVRVLDRHNVLTVQELCRTLELCVENMEQDATVKVSLQLRDFGPAELEQPLRADDISFLYGAVQECITNGMKHGGAEHFIVSLRMDEDTLDVEIRNDGAVPRAPLGEGFGLKKLRSYVDAVGGDLEIRLDGQYSLCMRLPLDLQTDLRRMMI